MPVATLVRGRASELLAPGDAAAVAGRIRVALRALRRSSCTASLVFTDDQEIRSLNRQYRKHDRATDVLSFHLQVLAGEDDPAGIAVELGDVVISVETARRRAPRRRLRGELERLAVHGLCHLFGHDHQRAGQARAMFTLEKRLLRLPV